MLRADSKCFALIHCPDAIYKCGAVLPATVMVDQWRALVRPLGTHEGQEARRSYQRKLNPATGPCNVGLLGLCGSIA